MVKIEQTGGRLTEEEILHGKEDAYGIYQINRKGAGRDYAFLSFDSLRSKGKVPERTEYQLVYSDILGADENRDSLFTKFNIAHPDDFTGHSLSVSDIILIKRNGKVNVSYVGSFSSQVFGSNSASAHTAWSGYFFSPGVRRIGQPMKIH